MGGGAGRNVAGSGVKYGEGAFLPASQVRRSQARGEGVLARVGHAARRQGIEGQRGTRDRGEVAIDVEDHIRRVRGVHADVSAGARRHDGRVGLDAAIQRVQRRNRRLRLSRGPYRQVAQISLRNDSDVERIGGCGSGNPTVGSAGNRKVLVRATLNWSTATVLWAGVD